MVGEGLGRSATGLAPISNHRGGAVVKTDPLHHRPAGGSWSFCLDEQQKNRLVTGSILSLRNKPGAFGFVPQRFSSHVHLTPYPLRTWLSSLTLEAGRYGGRKANDGIDASHRSKFRWINYREGWIHDSRKTPLNISYDGRLRLNSSYRCSSIINGRYGYQLINTCDNFGRRGIEVYNVRPNLYPHAGLSSCFSLSKVNNEP